MSGIADQDRLAEQITVLLHAPQPVLQRALTAVAAAHTLNERGHCICRPRGLTPRRGCPTRMALWTGIGEALSAAQHEDVP